MTLQTPRLHLQPFSPAHLLALIESNAAFEESFACPAAEGLRELFVSDDVSPAWLDVLRGSADAEPDPWVFGFAIIHSKNNAVVGTLGFKGLPDKDGVVEIAYGIAPEYEGQGIATEAAAAGVDFAFKSGRVKVVRAHTLPTNSASKRVLEKCGLSFIGEVVDPEDGPVWRWERKKDSEDTV
jgi:[ribosomal protein S5]-alanine N-acetyltransferase